jgi:hypothetical protein
MAASYPEQWSEVPFMGDKVLVNGKIWPRLRADQGKIPDPNGPNHPFSACGCRMDEHSR